MHVMSYVPERRGKKTTALVYSDRRGTHAVTEGCRNQGQMDCGSTPGQWTREKTFYTCTENTCRSDTHNFSQIPTSNIIECYKSSEHSRGYLSQSWPDSKHKEDRFSHQVQIHHLSSLPLQLMVIHSVQLSSSPTLAAYLHLAVI